MFSEHNDDFILMKIIDEIITYHIQFSILQIFFINQKFSQIETFNVEFI